MLRGQAHCVSEPSWQREPSHTSNIRRHLHEWSVRPGVQMQCCQRKKTSTIQERGGGGTCMGCQLLSERTRDSYLDNWQSVVEIHVSLDCHSPSSKGRESTATTEMFLPSSCAPSRIFWTTDELVKFVESAKSQDTVRIKSTHRA